MKHRILPYQVFDRPKTTEEIQAVTPTYPRISNFWAGVHLLLGRRPTAGDLISTARFLPDMISALPDRLRLLVTPDPPTVAGAPVAYIFYREHDDERKVLIYFVYFKS